MEIDRLEKILAISQEMARNRALNPLLDYAMDMAIDLFHAEYGYLVLTDQAGNIDISVKRDFRQRDVPHPEEQLSFSILREVIAERRPVLTMDAVVDPRYTSRQSVQMLQLRSVMCVPLITRDAAIGAFYIENRTVTSVFGDDDLKLLTLFANQSAVAIENARLNDHLEEVVASRTVQLEQAVADLERSWVDVVEHNRLRSELMLNVAHDLRSPLSIVIMTMSMMEAGELGETTLDQRTLLRSALDAASHVNNLINDLFEMGNLEQNHIELKPEPVALDDYLKEIYETGAMLGWSPAIDFRLELAPDLPVVVLDTTRIRQVVFNLITNAMKFTQFGAVTLYADTAAAHDRVMIGVRDTGIGIPADELDLVFDRFRRSTRSGTVKGTGLGLAICKSLVELHHGSIWVESPPQGGSDFKFALPLRMFQPSVSGSGTDRP
jgi:signal transduction histidine kinase